MTTTGDRQSLDEPPPLVRGEPVLEWAFTELRGDSLQQFEVAADIQAGGLLHELHDFGSTSRDSDIFFPDETSLPPDGIATGQITSSADGATYWVGAEAPAGNADIPEEAIGSQAQLHRTQSFIKRDSGASLSFTVSAAFIETTDLNAVQALPCPAEHEDGLFCDLIKGELFLDAIIRDLVGGEGDRTLTLTLTDPGGCATLGVPVSTELTIRDDDPAPPVVEPFVLDPTFGIGGKATAPGIGGDRSSMALQPDGKIVLAGGEFTAFVLARFEWTAR